MPDDRRIERYLDDALARTGDDDTRAELRSHIEAMVDDLMLTGTPVAIPAMARKESKASD